METINEEQVAEVAAFASMAESALLQLAVAFKIKIPEQRPTSDDALTEAVYSMRNSREILDRMQDSPYVKMMGGVFGNLIS